MTELEHELLFVRQALVAGKVRGQLGDSKAPRLAMQAFIVAPATNGKRASEREVSIAALPLAPAAKLTSIGHKSREGIAKRDLSRMEQELANLRAELVLRDYWSGK